MSQLIDQLMLRDVPRLMKQYDHHWRTMFSAAVFIFIIFTEDCSSASVTMETVNTSDCQYFHDLLL